jgi:hypothetical protein
LGEFEIFPDIVGQNCNLSSTTIPSRRSFDRNAFPISVLEVVGGMRTWWYTKTAWKKKFKGCMARFFPGDGMAISISRD